MERDEEKERNILDRGNSMYKAVELCWCVRGTTNTLVLVEYRE